MTVVACDGNVMVSDSMQSLGTLKEPVAAQKIHIVGDSIVGIAGVIAIALQVIDWMRNGREGEYPDPEGHAEFLILHKNGYVEYMGGGIPKPIPAGNMAVIGSGSPYALSAMLLGKTPKEAVEFACQWESTCDGPLQQFSIDDLPDNRGFFRKMADAFTFQ